MSTPRSRAARLLPALHQGFGVQYWGTTYSAEALAAQPHGILILETTKIGATYSDTGHEVFFTTEEIAAISHGGDRPVLGYLNVSEIENYRNYWIDHIGNKQEKPGSYPEWYGPHTDHGDHLAAYWTKGWRDIILTRVDRLMASGIDGLFLDDVLQYYNHALDETLRWPEGERSNTDGPSDAPGFAREMMHLVEVIAARAREWNCDALIIVNNGVFIGRDAAGPDATSVAKNAFSRYINVIDAIMVENVSSPDAHPHTVEALREDFQNNGIPALALDFATQFPEIEFSELRDLITEKTRLAGLFPYLSTDGVFNELYPPISLSPQAPVVVK